MNKKTERIIMLILTPFCLIIGLMLSNLSLHGTFELPSQIQEKLFLGPARARVELPEIAKQLNFGSGPVCVARLDNGDCIAKVQTYDSNVAVTPVVKVNDDTQLEFRFIVMRGSSMTTTVAFEITNAMSDTISMTVTRGENVTLGGYKADLGEAVVLNPKSHARVVGVAPDMNNPEYTYFITLNVDLWFAKCGTRCSTT